MTIRNEKKERTEEKERTNRDVRKTI